jgi:hypothetical protein
MSLDYSSDSAFFVVGTTSSFVRLYDSEGFPKVFFGVVVEKQEKTAIIDLFHFFRLA